MENPFGKDSLLMILNGIMRLIMIHDMKEPFSHMFPFLFEVLTKITYKNNSDVKSGRTLIFNMMILIQCCVE
jgi:hypothetical protein